MNLKPDTKPETMPGDHPDTAPEQCCSGINGTLPDRCAPMAYPFIAMQTPCAARYDSAEALRSGTLFPGLNLPFHVAMQSRFPDIPAPMAELMALDFAINELGLYLDTHPDDQEALELFYSYVELARKGREQYEKLYGPLDRQYRSTDGKYAWINDPWPWEGVNR